MTDQTESLRQSTASGRPEPLLYRARGPISVVCDLLVALCLFFAVDWRLYADWPNASSRKAVDDVPVPLRVILCTAAFGACAGGLFALHSLVGAKQRRRRRDGLCQHCAHRMPGIASDRCPECGHEVGR